MARAPKSQRVPRDEPQEWKENTERARAARAHVGDQLAEALLEADITGSPSLIAKRVRGMLEAEQTGDTTLARAATMELAIAAGVYAAGIDLLHESTGVTA